MDYSLESDEIDLSQSVDIEIGDPLHLFDEHEEFSIHLNHEHLETGMEREFQDQENTQLKQENTQLKQENTQLKQEFTKSKQENTKLLEKLTQLQENWAQELKERDLKESMLMADYTVKIKDLQVFF